MQLQEWAENSCCFTIELIDAGLFEYTMQINGVL